MMMSQILITGSEIAFCEGLSRYLEIQGCQVDVAATPREALERIEQTEHDLLLIDLREPGTEELELVEHLHRSRPDLSQVVVAGVEQRQAAVEAMRAGACDVIWRPVENLTELGLAVSRGLERRRLARGRTRYHSLLHSFPGVVFWGTAQFKVEIILGRVQEITGYPPETFTEGGLKWDEIIYPPDLAKISPQVRQCMRRGEPSEIQFRLRHPDGTLRWVECTLASFLDGQGAVQSVSGIVLDITKRKQAELALSQYLQEQETLFAIGQMVSSSLQIDEVLQQVAEHMTRLVGAASCAISDWDPDSGLLTVQAEYVRPDCVDPGDPVSDMGRAYDVADYPATAAALRERTVFVVYVNDPQADPRERRLLQRYQWRGVAGIPLVVQDRVIGLAEVYLEEEDQSFDRHDLRLLQSLANQVAVAIDNARLFTATQANEAAMRDLSLRLINVQEQERRYIAQELHDELGQILTATKINIDLARRKLARHIERQEGDEVVAAQSRLEEASALTDKVLGSVRAMTVELRPTLLDDMGILPTLRWHLGRFAKRTGIRVQLEADELPARLRAETETTIYRAVQEALTNVARHAQASQVQVRLACSDDTVTVSVEDDGQGFDVGAWLERPGEQQTLGLAGIRERALLLNGHARITSQLGEGTQITIELPACFRLEGE
jgi:PAS domain S-box-containing protein